MSKYTGIAEIKKKGAVQVSGGSVMRYKEPTSDLVRFQTQYVANYRDQQAHVPNVICKATQLRAGKKVTINRSGKSACCGPIKDAFHGSAPKDRGNF